MKQSARRLIRTCAPRVVALACLFLAPSIARAHSGVRFPSSSDKPNPAILTLDEMSVEIKIDNQYARIRVMQIFGNRTGGIQEGKYVFLIPTTASISDFAVWDGDVRIPGVILEKRRAEEIYQDLALQTIDPGLLSQESEDKADTAFTVKLTPIPAYGTKRPEIEYTEPLPVDNLESPFSFPFKPSQYGTQTVGHLSLRLQIASKFAMSDLNVRSRIYPLNFIDNRPEFKSASFEGNDVQLTEDFSFG